MKALVVGAGMAGSAAAWRLSRRGHEVMLVERKDRLGGRAWTDRQAGFSIDVGADVILSFYAATLALLDELGRRDHLVELEPGGVMRGGRRAHKMRPASPRGILTHPELNPVDMARLGLAAARARLGRGVDLFDLDALAAADDGETIAQWARRTLGERSYQHIIRPGVETRWYYSCEEAAAPLAKALSRLAPRTRFFCLEPGMGSFAEWLAEGVETIRAEIAAVELEDGSGVLARTAEGDTLRADAAVIATDAGRAAGLLGGGEVADTLAAVRFAHNVRVVLGYRQNPWPSPRAKAAFATGPGRHRVAAATLISGKSPARVPAGAQAAEVHFSGWASAELDDSEAIAAAHSSVAEIFGDPGEPAIFELAYRCDPGLPIPVPGQYARLAEARDRMPPRIRLAGDYLSHATVEGAVRSGERAADDLDSLEA